MPKPSPIKQLALPVLLFALLWLLEFRGGQTFAWITNDTHLILRAALYLAAGWLTLRIIRVFWWQRREHKLRGTAAPALLQHVVTILVVGVTAAVIANRIFSLPVTGFWATSSVVGLVLGIALRSLIADFFSGIALEIDPPFRIGDYIEIRRSGDPIIGRVTDMNWRATQVQTRGQVSTIYIPNSELSAASVVNIYSPLNQSRFETLLTFDTTVPVKRVRRIVLAAARLTAQVLPSPSPELLVNRFSNAGIEYKVRYWLTPDTSPDLAKHELLANVAHQLRRAGLSTSGERRDLLVSRKKIELEDKEHVDPATLAHIPFFAPFQPDELEQIAAGLIPQRFKPEKTIIQAGDPGESIFIVGEGLLEVLIHGADGQPLRAAQLASGDIVGEMSLLNGEPRTATVVSVTDVIVYEMKRDDIQEIVAARPEVAEHLSKIAAKRKMKNEKLEMTPSAAEDSDQAHHRISTEILSKMRKLFAEYL